jgi:MFS family permease
MAEPEIVGSPGAWRVTPIVSFALFMDYFVYGLATPLTLYSPAGIGGGGESGLLYGGYAAGVLLATPLFGYLGRRIGLRPLMICGVILLAIGMALFWAAPTILLLFLARLLQGAAAAATWTAGLSLIATHHTGRRVEMMGYALMGSTAGSVLGPVACGLLYDAGGYGLPFLVVGGLLACDALLRILALPADRNSEGHPPRLGALLRDRSVLTPAAAVALAALGWSVIEPLLPLRLDRAGVEVAGIGVIFTIATIAYGLSAPLVSWVSLRVPIRKLMAAGALWMALALPLLGVAEGRIAIAAALCLVSVGFAFLLNPTSAELGNAIDRRGMSCYSVVYAIYNIAYSVGMIATNAFAASAASYLSFGQILLCVSGALILAIPFLLRDGAAVAVAAREPAEAGWLRGGASPATSADKERSR